MMPLSEVGLHLPSFRGVYYILGVELGKDFFENISFICWDGIVYYCEYSSFVTASTAGLLFGLRTDRG